MLKKFGTNLLRYITWKRENVSDSIIKTQNESKKEKNPIDLIIITKDSVKKKYYIQISKHIEPETLESLLNYELRLNTPFKLYNYLLEQDINICGDEYVETEYIYTINLTDRTWSLKHNNKCEFSKSYIVTKNPIVDDRLVFSIHFATRLYGFLKLRAIEKACMYDACIYDEYEDMLHYAHELLSYQVQTCTDEKEMDYLKRCETWNINTKEKHTKSIQGKEEDNIL